MAKAPKKSEEIVAGPASAGGGEGRLRASDEDRVQGAHPQDAEGSVRLHQRDADPQARQDRREHGDRRGRDRLQEGPDGDEGSRRHHRPETDADQGPQIHRRLQAARRHGRRRQGHSTQGPDVRVPRPADHRRSAPGEGLPGPEADQLRRPRQLRHGPSRSTWCSRRSTTTRSTRSGAWTSSSAPPPRSDDEARALLKEFQFPFTTA